MRAGQPRVDEHVLGGQPVPGVLLQQAADEALGARTERVRQAELAPADLGEEAAMLSPMKWIPEKKRFSFKEKAQYVK